MTTTTARRTTPDPGTLRSNPARIYVTEAQHEFLKLIRIPIFAVSTIALPVLFYVLFGLAFGGGDDDGGGGGGRTTYMMATYGTFGVIGAALFGGGAGAALGGYTSTAEGKIVAASFLDNWNKIVASIRNNPSLIQAKGSAASQANAAGSVRANAGSAGDVYVPKISGVKVFRSAGEGPELTTLGRTEEVIFEGEEQNGFMKIATPKGSGWVKAIMMRKP